MILVLRFRFGNRFCSYFFCREIIIKGLVIAGTKSGSGKTTITLGFMAALARRGLCVAPFKVGPDFIDPGHHASVTSVFSRNLDGWMLSKDYNLKTFRKHSEHADIAVIEGVMGLFDGYDGKSEAGSTAQMAKWLDLPVLLVVDAKSMARSAAALVQGFERFDPSLKFAGVVFNNIGSKNHLTYLKDALENHVHMPCAGGIVYNDEISIPERHLGLVTRDEHALSEQNINSLADMIEKNINLDALIKSLPEIKPEINIEQEQKILKPLVRIGTASDKAFCFYYQDNFDILKSLGAELVYFSPVNDKNLPGNIDGIYLGGGYPELFAEKLGTNKGVQAQIREKSLDNMPIYAECGGFMYLCKEIFDQEGKSHSMTGCFPFSAAMFPRLKALGYREIILKKQGIIGNTGTKIRGHEFHYSGITGSQDIKPGMNIDKIYEVADKAGKTAVSEGYQVNKTLGSYIHLHFGSCPGAALNFVKECREYRHKRTGT
ncbi:Cobyrinate a,c-diamide synthase [Desulfonema limicola]|uniref:Cobyrinate a,c-diamide synthase n=1 Tax=Desulfonema limicola TaxID=45656 RepID=A0A975BCX0_9BACT|nr:cobyrinate a,c-diamide synthase [Desulfonema limicola]QTA83057.1 Cobyrinate a,c-diamide synthase [Desulfonema limicola]